MGTTDLTQEMQNLKIQELIIENNVLFFLQKNHKDSTDDQISQVLKDNFAEVEIVEAKHVLASEPYITALTKCDKEVGIAITTKRRNSRTKKDRALNAVIIDLMNSIDAFEASTEIVIKIVAKDDTKIPKYRAENAQFKSILDRLDKVEGIMEERKQKLEQQDTVIKQLVTDYETISKENKELRAEVIKLNGHIFGSSSSGISSQEVKDINRSEDVGNDTPEPAEPAPVPSPLPTDDANQAQPPPPSQAPPPTPPPTNVSPPPIPESAAGEWQQKQKRKKLSTKQKTEVRKVYEENSLLAAVVAASQGTPTDKAIEIGRATGTAKAHSFAQAAKLRNSTTNAGAPSPNTEFPELRAAVSGAAVSGAATSGAAASGSAGKAAMRNKLAKTAPYKRGNATATDQTMNMQKPTFMNNKCLVIRGLKKGISREQFIEYIDKTAGKKINILHTQIISRVYSPWLTVAIELNTEDFELLSDVNIWHTSIGIREYIGWRHWHGERPKRVPPQEIRNSVRMSWAENSSTTL